ncbi:serine/threonine protein kinase [Enhygromyxa salina]|uniref:serine/threonine protein kinase n=1 Tax=Enhygromyxa salina TaxID=215803 RepID=UPI0015E7C676|nr:serine/threonine-protein kinase [Enhygromyxa salina]
MKFGRFELLELLGEGGMGVVFRARDTKLNREVALKLLTLPSEEAEAAVLHEAQCLAKLAHPNVVGLYDIGKLGDDLFLTMEYVEGMDGHTMLTSYTPTWQQTINIFMKAGRGLAAAHAAGLEHGDFKLDNILLDDKGERTLVADFGVARALRDQGPDEAGADRKLDDNGRKDSVEGGTLDYMAPERLGGLRGDARSDQYSFCVAFWECLYRQRPFEGESAEELRLAIAHRMLCGDGRGRKIPRRLSAVITRGLSFNPGDRWPDMASLLDALEEIRRSDEQRPQRLRVVMIGLALAVACSLVTAALVRAPASRATQTGGLADLADSVVDLGNSSLADAGVRWAGPAAVAFARAGQEERALQILDPANFAERSTVSCQRLASAGEAVALEFERRGLNADATLAWGLTIHFARGAGDDTLESRAHTAIYGIANRTIAAPHQSK